MSMCMYAFLYVWVNGRIDEWVGQLPHPVPLIVVDLLFCRHVLQSVGDNKQH